MLATPVGETQKTVKRFEGAFPAIRRIAESNPTLPLLPILVVYASVPVVLGPGASTPDRRLVTLPQPQGCDDQRCHTRVAGTCPGGVWIPTDRLDRHRCELVGSTSRGRCRPLCTRSVTGRADPLYPISSLYAVSYPP